MRGIRRAAIVSVACAVALLAAGVPAVADTSTPEPSASDTPTPSPTATFAAEPSVHVVAADQSDLQARAAQIVAAMSPEELAGTVVMGSLSSRDLPTLQAYMSDSHLGGFILMGANVSTEQQTRELTDGLVTDPALPPLLAVDQEGGVVKRLYWDQYPAASALRVAGPGDAEAAFASRGALVARAGIGVNFGIIADETDNRSSFIFNRILGETPADAMTRVASAVIGEAPYAASTLKHFPGHGALAANSHFTVPETDMAFDLWRNGPARPFSAGIDAGAPLVMMGHLAYTAVDDGPASLSSAWYDVLRDDLGFTGVAVTDDLGMLVQSGDDAYADIAQDAVLALAAGADLVLAIATTSPETAGQIVQAIQNAVTTGALSEDRLTDAAIHCVALRLQLAGAGRGAVLATE
ncbi:MAG: glycoside hydrolase family 3 N-terminal domain-containing protein [Microbacterium sp.]